MLYFFVRVNFSKINTCQSKDKNKTLGTLSIKHLLNTFVPTGALVFLVLGSILWGLASPTEAAGCGAFGGILIATYRRKISKKIVFETATESVKMTTMVFGILIGAQVFGLIFRLLSGDEMLVSFINHLNFHPYGMLASILLLIFLLGFVIDFLEICFIVIPIVLPIFHLLGFTGEKELLVLAILIAINLQTSFLTPPFGFALFYLKASSKQVSMADIYKGVWPFVLIQLFVLLLLVLFPKIITFLPDLLNR